MTNIERLVELEKTLDALIAKARASSNPNATLLVTDPSSRPAAGAPADTWVGWRGEGRWGLSFRLPEPGPQWE